MSKSVSSIKGVKYIYKIQPHSSVDTRFTFPIPIPASHQFFLTALDSQDGYIHLSTPVQVPGVLNRFFEQVESVVLLRLEVDRVGGFKRLIWENSHGESYPHLYAQLEGEDVNSFKEVHKKGRSWDKALGDVEGWLI